MYPYRETAQGTAPARKLHSKRKEKKKKEKQQQKKNPNYFPLGSLPNSFHAFARRGWHGAENKCLCSADPLVLQPIAHSALSVQYILNE